MIKQLIRQMDQTVKKWGKKGNEPSLPNIAGAVEAWQKDIENLPATDDVSSQSYNMALASIRKAWESRDNRVAMMSILPNVVRFLKEIDGEINVDEENADKDAVLTAKALFGDTNAHYEHSTFRDLYDIKRRIKGMLNARISDIDYTGIVRLEEDVRQLASSYPEGSFAFKSAIKTLQDVNRIRLSYANGVHPRSMKRQMQNAIKSVDVTAMYADRLANTDYYRPELVGNNVRAAKTIAENIDNIISTYRFYTPSTFAAKLIPMIKSLQLEITKYNDPVAKRMVKTVLNDALTTHRIARSPRIKSYALHAWKNNSVSDALNNMLNNWTELNTRLNAGLEAED